MAEYIGREEAVNALDRLCNRVCQYSKRQRGVMCGACPLGGAFDVIMDNVPAADVAPVRHGRWVKKHDDNCYWYECSECGDRPPKDQWKYQWLSPYCPNCGAKMDLEEENK